jgi:hypothetical protein
MPHIGRFARVLVIFALLLVVFAPALPAARASDLLPQAPPPPPSAPAGNGASLFPQEPPTCGAGGYVQGKTDGRSINDFATITSTIPFPDVGPYIWDVNVSTNITHTSNQDLDIHLVSPASIIVTLSANNGGGNPGNVFSGTTWDDQAGLTNGSGLPVTDYIFTPDTPALLLNPQEPLGAFQGEGAGGNWLLAVHDGNRAIKACSGAGRCNWQC